MPAVLETERLLFRPHILADLDAWCAMEMDADVRRYVGGSPRTREEAERRFPRLQEQIANGLAVWAAIYKPENKYIGRCGIYQHLDQNGEPLPGEAALGVYIAKDYWGRGLATEATSAFVDFGFNRLGMRRIVTMVQVGNDASVRVMEKIGLSVERIETGAYRSFYHFVIENPNI